MKRSPNITQIPLQSPLFRGKQRLRIALVGMPGSGRSTIFQAVSSTSVVKGELAGSQRAYRESLVQIGLDEANVIDLPSLNAMHHLKQPELATVQYLLWGNQLPPISAREAGTSTSSSALPDVIIQVVDATALDRHLELTFELSLLGRPLIIALNMMDQADTKGMHIGIRALSRKLGVPVVPTVAHMGHGISQLFQTAADTVRQQSRPSLQQVSQHIYDQLKPLCQLLNKPEIHDAFHVPNSFLLMQIAAGDDYFMGEMQQHFPALMPELIRLRNTADQIMPRGLSEELHADRHHKASRLFETVTRLGAPHDGRGWRYWLDELFLHPQWGLLGSLAVFAMVLVVVFEVSAWLDSMTAARLIEWVSDWQPRTVGGVIGRAVTDGLIGLIGIVVPYMLPLVLLLVALEESGIMHRIAFVVDRGFHHIGLHGGVAVPFLLGLGCNVPAIASAARTTSGRERVIASVLITFVPCSARSAVILALAGKYLGGIGVFAIFILTIVVIAVLGQLLTRHFPERRPGQVQDIPPYAIPAWSVMLHETWLRTSDILTIVTPLLIGGSVILALLNYVGADAVINMLFTPVTSWWLGLPVVLGVPILFGVLRKELSLLMIYQALGSFDVSAYMDLVQLTTFLLFLNFYIPCVSTFAVMLKTIGRKQALFSIMVSVTAALLVSGIARFLLEGIRLIIY